jgi:hypothetical protein
MDHLCNIERVSLASDGGGGQVETWGAQHTNLICRGWYKSAGVMPLGGKAVIAEQRSVIVPLGKDIREGDRIVSVRDRAGNVIFAGPMMIDSVAHRQDHQQLYSLETN